MTRQVVQASELGSLQCHGATRPNVHPVANICMHRRNSKAKLHVLTSSEGSNWLFLILLEGPEKRWEKQKQKERCIGLRCCYI